jgi:ACT domain-containing protein
MEKQQNATLKKAEMIKALEKSLGIVTTACKQVGIDRTTHYRWLNSDEKYKEAVEDLKNVTLDFAETHLHKAIQEGNTTAIIFLLKTLGKKRGYVERQEIQHDTDISSKLIEWTPAKDKQ